MYRRRAQRGQSAAKNTLPQTARAAENEYVLSISIELCDTMRDGKYDFSEKTLANAALLCRELMQKYHIPLENVIRHFDVVGKICPAPFVENTAAWQAFRERLGDEMVEMVQVEIDGKIVDMEGQGGS